MSKKPDDAAKVAGLASILQSGNRQKEPPAATPSPALPPAATPEAPNQRKKTGKLAKSRDPNFHHYGFYLRKDTHKRATRLWEDKQPDQDFSDLLQTLLEQWLASN